MRYFKFRECNQNNFHALEHNQIYTNSIFNYNDPFEGASWVNPQMDVLENQDCEQKRSHLIERINRRTYFCVSHSEKDDIITNIKMWSHYADSHKGFCIEYNENLLDGLHKSNEWNESAVANIALEVAYLDEMPDMISDDNKTLRDIIQTKYSDWHEEKEIRLVYRGINGLKDIPEGAVEAIYLGCNISPRNASKLRKIANKLNVPCHQMEKSGQSYKLTYCH